MVAGFVGGVAMPTRTARRAVCVRAIEEEAPAKPRLRKEIFDGFKKDYLPGFPGRGMGSKFDDLDMRPVAQTMVDVCDDCGGTGVHVCTQCFGRQYFDPVSGEVVECDACHGETVICSTCMGTGKRPTLEGPWWEKLPNFFG